MLERLAHAIELLDEPFADPSILPVSLLCEFARDRVTVALAGDGGDELFAGYDPFRAVRAADWYRRWVPGWLHERRSGLHAVAARVVPEHVAAVQAVAVLAGRRRPSPPAVRNVDGRDGPGATRPARSRFGLRLARRAAYGPVLAAYDKLEAMDADTLDQALHFFQRFYLVDDILVKVDRASMMHSLEVRSPFLDTSLVEYVNSLPHDLKLRGGVTKYLFKESLRCGDGQGPIVPREIIDRRKKGFGIPVARWIRREQAAAFREALSDAWPGSLLPMFDRAAVRGLLEAHVQGRENHYKELWALFVLSHWARRHLTPAPVPSPARATAVAL